MAGFAIWCEGEKSKQKNFEPYSVHFNLWADYCDKKNDAMLDVGIKIPYTYNLKKICFYLPYKLQRSNISDLGKSIASEKNLLDSVFNESYISQEMSISKTYSIKNKNDEEVFRIYSLDTNKQSDICVDMAFEGTVITINLENKQFENGKLYYFRFRCSGKNLNNIIERKSKNLLLESICTENNFIDFRLNDWRSYGNSSLVERIQTKSMEIYRIEKINFFLMVQGEIEVYSINKKSERKLENSIWQNYIGCPVKNVIIASQWQKKRDDEKENFVESFSTYAHFKKQWCTIAQIFKYVIIFGIINFLYMLLYSLLFTNTIIQLNIKRISYLSVILLLLIIISLVVKRVRVK